MSDFRKYNNGPTVDPELIKLANDMIVGCSEPKGGCDSCEKEKECRRVFDNYVTPDKAYYRMTIDDALRVRKYLRKVGCQI